MTIHLDNISLTFQGEATPLFENFNLSLSGWTCLLGQSGCGKTTLLRHIAGLTDPQHHTTGRVDYQSRDTTTPLGNEHIAYMGQQDLLFPWLSVLDNICLQSVITGKKPNKAQRDQAHQLLIATGLDQHDTLRPDQLSGGLRQRVALARTLMLDKPIVLMDEPFSALDAVTRYKLQDLSAKLLKDKIVVLITHDPQEALRLGEHIYVMQNKPAQLKELSTPVSPIPRKLSAEFAAHQQAIIDMLANEVPV
ncbi:ABC transporter ATP-binding protein [Thaumasiovibrio sp. DFM-14]|uniref:ABC transporter ATP-binding protein n=1 Tax=Thaumasiovibrio sp. DFM-14 TaxID=3384792 RepID=UPI00399F1BBF